MKNKEYWKEKILEIALSGTLVGVKNGVPERCKDLRCQDCDFHEKCLGDHSSLVYEWGETEYTEHVVTKIEEAVKMATVDTPVLVSQDGKRWYRRHFCNYDKQNDTVICLSGGYTSWSITLPNDYKTKWRYAKLPNEYSGYYSEKFGQKSH